MGLFGGLINNFDRGIEILDDLDDHWYLILYMANFTRTAKHHKKVYKIWLLTSLLRNATGL